MSRNGENGMGSEVLTATLAKCLQDLLDAEGQLVKASHMPRESIE